MNAAQNNSALATDLLPLFEFGKIINSSLNLTFILNTLLLTLMGKLLVTRGIVLLQREKGWFEIVAAKGVEQQLLGHTIPIRNIPRAFVSIDRTSIERYRWLSFFRQRQLSVLTPIVVQRKIVGIIALGRKPRGKRLSSLDKTIIRTLVDLAGSAIEKAAMVEQLQQLNRNLDRKYQELNTLFDLSKEFNLGLDENRVLRLLTFSLLGQVGVNRYAICLLQDGKVMMVSSRLDSDADLTSAVVLCCTLRTPSLTAELYRKKKFRDVALVLEKAGIAAIIPMQVQKETKGLILLGRKLRGGEYTSSDLEFLYSLANLAIISIENAKLFRDAIEKQRLEDELAIAREIQQGLLPRTLPHIPGFDLAAVNIPSTQVGGDYYDVIQRSDREVILAIGDVSGKGTPAALLMANVQASLRALTSVGLTLSEATGRINDLMCLNTSSGKFITLFWGVLDVPTKRFCYVNAGHNFPFLLRADGAVERLEEGGLLIGMLKTTSPYEQGTVTLQSGDLLVLFTDGVSEAMNAEGHDFTEERFEQLLRRIRTASPHEIIDRVREELQGYTRDTPPSDDLTMLVLKAL